mmetsp:Transcript_20141/g.37874  ORF Transcript_20141/g.37874 Transcript_20141/m.37874 type:complete len:215 (-) Transcript_20141:282-926(-)|eukprot:CAMPEP_0170167902 /NCGR_PEP_ID=MMETSP0040_2-20121228/1159_1 /TAXON_ID=641309 /ORGANISM="Lotharella oceanica, Strain CCMP622" /LENGTH=214 /DNA_ID=CAMNT_0010406049 /DNA_START=184 /DNA_END=828 /DNA_ORIENTATION=-
MTEVVPELTMMDVMISRRPNSNSLEDVIPRIRIFTVDEHEIICIQHTEPRIILLMDWYLECIKRKHSGVQRDQNQQCRILNRAAIRIEKMRIDECMVILVSHVHQLHFVLYSMDYVGDEIINSKLEEHVDRVYGGVEVIIGFRHKLKHPCDGEIRDEHKKSFWTAPVTYEFCRPIEVWFALLDVFLLTMQVRLTNEMVREDYDVTDKNPPYAEP